MKRKQFVFCIAGIVLLAGLLAGIGLRRMPPQTSAQAATFEDAVNAVANTFGEEALVYNGIYDREKEFGNLDELGFENVVWELQYIYHSEQTGRDYYFTEDGVLAKIYGNISETKLENTNALLMLEESELDENMRSFATGCLEPNRIGEMVIYSKENSMGRYDYVFQEIYQDVQTGARVAVECLPDGTIVFAVVVQGGCFEKLADGTIVPVHTIEITPEQANKIAIAAVEERLQGKAKAHITEKEPVCKLEALEDKQFYNVELETTCPEHDNCFVTYWVHVDVTDGTVLEIEHTV